MAPAPAVTPWERGACRGRPAFLTSLLSPGFRPSVASALSVAQCGRLSLCASPGDRAGDILQPLGFYRRTRSYEAPPHPLKTNLNEVSAPFYALQRTLQINDGGDVDVWDKGEDVGGRVDVFVGNISLERKNEIKCLNHSILFLIRVCVCV